ncbi:MAG: hypothetical protein CM1200mP30_14360 [Pseudomonadota bacterium]|nr:MAG: hypothetical protein CM1200mP30_14360 [Pseudomonadota bacterium]
MSVSLTNTSAEPLLKTNSGFCSHCLLTLGSHPTKRAVDGEEYFFAAMDVAWLSRLSMATGKNQRQHGC